MAEDLEIPQDAKYKVRWKMPEAPMMIVFSKGKVMYSEHRVSFVDMCGKTVVLHNLSVEIVEL